MTTPAAHWREAGETDPHEGMYDCERHELCKGDSTDDELANEVFLSPDIVNLTAAKERIRWLSRQLVKSEEKYNELQIKSSAAVNRLTESLQAHEQIIKEHSETIHEMKYRAQVAYEQIDLSKITYVGAMTNVEYYGDAVKLRDGFVVESGNLSEWFPNRSK